MCFLRLLLVVVASMASLPAFAAILAHKQIKIDFTDAADAKAKAVWALPEKLSITKEGLGWDGEPRSSYDGWIQTKPIAIGYAWRPPANASLRVTIQPAPLNNGQTSTPYQGTVYARYSPDRQHWSSWQVLKTDDPHTKEPEKGRRFSGALQVPYRERARYQARLQEFMKRDVSWQSDEEAAVKWILEGEPDFFAKQLPFCGYVELLFEAGFRGGRRIRSMDVGIGYSMSGMMMPPKDLELMEKASKRPWEFAAQPQPEEKPDED